MYPEFINVCRADTPLASRTAFMFTTTATPPTGAVLASDPKRMQLDSPLRALEQRGLEFQDVHREDGGSRPGNNAFVLHAHAEP
jgi:hypothetical protein